MSLESDGRIRLKCNHCGATYTYSSESINSLGYLQCQNCAFRITLQGGQPTGTVSTQERDWLPSSAAGRGGLRHAKCPMCGSTYAYTVSSISEDGTVVCQNCNEVFPFAAHSRPSLDTAVEGPEIV